MFIGAYIAAVTLTSFWTFIAWRNAADYNTIYQKNQGVNFNDYSVRPVLKATGYCVRLVRGGQ